VLDGDSLIIRFSNNAGAAWLLLGAWTAAPAAFAVPGDAAIDEIQVTASRRAMQASEVSAGVTLIRADEVLTANVATDLLSNRPGAYLQETTPGQGAAIVRGLKGSELLHLVDGTRLNNAIFRNAPTQYAALIDPRGIERVEVVRGASASLYGSSAMGGVVNFLMRRPRFDGPDSRTRGDLSATLNSADLLTGVSGELAHGNERFAWLARLSWLETGNRRSGSGERIKSSAYESKAARLAATFEPDERRTWYFDLQALEQPSTNRVDELVPGFGEAEPGSSEFAFEPNARYFAHLEHRIDDALLGADWDLDLSWQRIVDDRRSRGYQSIQRRLEKNRSDLFVVDVDASRAFGASEWLVGVEWMHDRVHSSRQAIDITTGASTAATARFPDGSTVEQFALYTRVQVTPGDRHRLFAGLRYNAAGISIPASPVLAAAELDFDDVSGDFGWTFHVADGINLVANLGRGFRAPNIFDLGTLGERPGNRFNVPNPNLDAEHVTQFDVGVKAFGDGYSFEAFVFSLDYEDRIESVSTGAVTPAGRNVTQSRNLASADLHGAELAIFVEPSATIRIDALLNYVRGTSRVADDPETPADRVPPLNGRVGVTWLPTANVSTEFFALFAAGQDRLSPRDVNDPRIDPGGTPGWATLHAGIVYQRGDSWTIRAGIDNIFDVRYRVHGSGVDARGRNAVVSAEYRW